MNTGATPETGAVCDLDYQDTIGLLQEEITRLEEELQMRIEAAEATSKTIANTFPEPDEATDRRIAELADDLKQRDETIDLLWEQVLRFEEAETAGRAEWEQLHRWVEELENRIEGQSATPEELQAALEDQRRQTDALRLELDLERKAWEARRRRFEAQIEQLRSPSDAAGHELQIRADESETETGAEAEARAEALREQLQAAQAALEATRQDLRKSEDERLRERRELEVEQAVQRRLQAREMPPAEDQGLKANEALSPDQRIRALREHLREIHRREEEERKNRQLSTRLSRLWKRTGPKGGGSAASTPGGGR
ncbi:hypothetical protein BH23PLA1_BH23PLA1_15980 [soil metagenome]